MSARTMLKVALATAACALLAPVGAAAQAPGPAFGPWDGSNPYRCQLQDVDRGVDFPDPDADPFCVKFNKTHQSVLPDAGLVEFLANEPFRVAAAVSKCFYFQTDHWTGRLDQGLDPELWNWTGDYYFNRAKGSGGVHVRNLRIAGQPLDATPYVPDEYLPWFERQGGGGAEVSLGPGEVDPSCASKVDTPRERGRVYRDEAIWPRCIAPGGKLRGRRAGKARLGMTRESLRKRLGEPAQARNGVDRWCVTGGANLRVAASDGKAAVIRTTVPGHSARGVRTGDRAKRARERLGLKRRFSYGTTSVLESRRADTSKRRLFAALENGRVAYLAIAERDRSASQVKRSLKRSR